MEITFQKLESSYFQGRDNRGAHPRQQYNNGLFLACAVIGPVSQLQWTLMTVTTKTARSRETQRPEKSGSKVSQVNEGLRGSYDANFKMMALNEAESSNDCKAAKECHWLSCSKDRVKNGNSQRKAFHGPKTKWGIADYQSRSKAGSFRNRQRAEHTQLALMRRNGLALRRRTTSVFALRLQREACEFPVICEENAFKSSAYRGRSSVQKQVQVVIEQWWTVIESSFQRAWHPRNWMWSSISCQEQPAHEIRGVALVR